MSRRSPVAATLALLGPLVLAAGLLAPTAARGAEPGPTPGPTPVPTSEPAASSAALERAEAFARGELTGGAAGALGSLPGLGGLLAARLPTTPGVDGSEVQRELFRAAGDLSGAERKRAERLLARPTDGRRDLVGDGYRVASRRTCSLDVCVHWVPTTQDAPPGRAWVRRTLRVLERVWRTEVGRLGYRAPRGDGTRGGDARFDVYLQDVGQLGAYGYCTPEGRPAAVARAGTAAGYCVLDDDFSARQFAGAAPARSLKVTAAHEFFHAVQLAYDVGADPWFAESTAVWMEGRVFGSIDDNRQFLPYGQLERPRRSLDGFQPTGFAQYGNWVFWERLSRRFGTGVVKRVWTRSAARGSFSAAALRDELAARGASLPAVLAEYGGALTDPAASYREGRRWPAGAAPDPIPLDPRTGRAQRRTRLDHLATTSWVVRPGVVARGTRLVVAVRGPSRVGAVHVRVLRPGGRVVERAVVLDRRGRGRVVAPFGAAGVRSVTITVANGSTRFTCERGTRFSCAGAPRDDDRRFRLRASTAPAGTA